MQEGDSSDPFAEADRREREQRKAEKARSHTALTFPSAAQPQAAAAPTSAPQLTYGSAPATSAPATAMQGSSKLASTLHVLKPLDYYKDWRLQACLVQQQLLGSPLRPVASFTMLITGGQFGMPQSGAASGLFGAPAASGAAFGAQQTPNPSPFGGTPLTPPAFGAPFGGSFGSQTNFNKPQTQQKSSKTSKSGRR
ncbi:MAG: hypothetical protein Q9186_007165 [Xanthomendoza sp. 1 TL-2023]